MTAKKFRKITAVLCAVAALSLSGCNIRFEDEKDSTANTAESTSAVPPVSEAPKTEVSNTPAPETSVSETPAPETKPQETPAPVTEPSETSAPETTVSETYPTLTDIPAPVTEPTESLAPPERPPADGMETAGIVILLPEGSGYRGMYCFDGTPRQAEIYAGYINRFKEQVGNANVYSMVVPTACEFYCPEKYIKSLGITSEKEFIESEGRALVNVTQVNVYSVFAEHKDEYITLKTDHHWAPLGAYYCAQKFARIAGVPFADLSQYDTYVEHGYIGSHYYYSDNNPKIGNHPEDFVYYIPKADYTATEYEPSDHALTGGHSVSIAIKGDVGYYRYCPDDRVKRVITSGVKNGRKLMMIKDSYGDALAPMLLGSFEEIYFTDLRFIGCNAADFAKKHGVTDVLFVTNAMVTKECGGYLYDLLQ